MWGKQPTVEDTGYTFDTAEGPAESPILFQESEKLQPPGVEMRSEEHPLLAAEIPTLPFSTSKAASTSFMYIYCFFLVASKSQHFSPINSV